MLQKLHTIHRRLGTLFVLAILLVPLISAVAPQRASAAISPLGTYDACEGTCGCWSKIQNPVVLPDTVINECGMGSSATITGNVVYADAWGESATLSADGSTLAWQDGSRWVRSPQGCATQVPSDPDTALLSQLVYAEATRSNSSHPITPADSADEMAAIAYTVMNRYNHIKDGSVRPSTFNVRGKAANVTIPDVIYAHKQYGSVGSDNFNAAAHPDQFDITTQSGKNACDFLGSAVDAAANVRSSSVADPYAAQGGTFAMRTKKHGPPGGKYNELTPGIPNSGNTFYTLDPKMIK